MKEGSKKKTKDSSLSYPTVPPSFSPKPSARAERLEWWKSRLQKSGAWKSTGNIENKTEL